MHLQTAGQIGLTAPRSAEFLDFSSVTVSFFIHSTEDEDRLMEMVRKRLGLEEDEITREKAVGYFGNEIISIRAHIIGDRAQATSLRIIRLLSKSARTLILSEIEKSLDEHDALYLRLDRQSLKDDFLSISDEEPIRIKLKPKNRFGGRSNMLQEYKDLIA